MSNAASIPVRQSTVNKAPLLLHPISSVHGSRVARIFGRSSLARARTYTFENGEKTNVGKRFRDSTIIRGGGDDIAIPTISGIHVERVFPAPAICHEDGLCAPLEDALPRPASRAARSSLLAPVCGNPAFLPRHDPVVVGAAVPCPDVRFSGTGRRLLAHCEKTNPWLGPLPLPLPRRCAFFLRRSPPSPPSAALPFPRPDPRRHINYPRERTLLLRHYPKFNTRTDAHAPRRTVFNCRTKRQEQAIYLNRIR